MELTTDVSLKGTAWATVIEQLSPIFKTRTHHMIFMLSLAIGIMYDKSVPRNVMRNHDNGKLDFIFQAAILSTSTEAFTEDERLDLAFGDKTEFNKIDFLTQFANFGVTKLAELIGDTTLESMENIKNFLASSIEGRNLDIDALPDDILLDDEI